MWPLRPLNLNRLIKLTPNNPIQGKKIEAKENFEGQTKSSNSKTQNFMIFSPELNCLELI